jgi:hypothetical protein
LATDDGAEPRLALKWLALKGCLLEHFWQYNMDVLDKHVPSSANAVEAAKYPLLTYYRITAGVDGICSAISQGYYVSIGTPWYDKWVDPVGQDGVLDTVTNSETPAGGHETCLYGYDRTKQTFYGINSWSADWGKKGLYEMPFQAFPVFNKWGGYDAHYITANWGAAIPAPTPTPTTAVRRVRLQESKDNGKSWVNMFDGSIE